MTARVAALISLLILATHVVAQPAYISSRKPYDYAIRLIKEDVVCHLTNLECFYAPKEGPQSVDQNTLLNQLPSKDGWTIERQKENWKHVIELSKIKNLTYHHSFGHIMTTFQGKDVVYHRFVSQQVSKAMYLIEGDLSHYGGVQIDPQDSAKCFKENEHFALINGRAGQYLMRRGFWFFSAICRSASAEQPGAITFMLSSAVNQQHTVPEFFISPLPYTQLKFYDWKKFQQVIFTFGDQQFTMHAATCKLIQAQLGVNTRSAENEQLVFAASTGHGNELMSSVAVRAQVKEDRLGGINTHVAYCRAGGGTYIDHTHSRVANGIKEDPDHAILIVNVKSKVKSRGSSSHHHDDYHHHKRSQHDEN